MNRNGGTLSTVCRTSSRDPVTFKPVVKPSNGSFDISTCVNISEGDENKKASHGWKRNGY